MLSHHSKEIIIKGTLFVLPATHLHCAFVYMSVYHYISNGLYINCCLNVVGFVQTIKILTLFNNSLFLITIFLSTIKESNLSIQRFNAIYLLYSKKPLILTLSKYALFMLLLKIGKFTQKQKKAKITKVQHFLENPFFAKVYHPTNFAKNMQLLRRCLRPSILIPPI